MLVCGAAGGVGTVAVQLARAAGAQVLAGRRAAEPDLLAELGTDQVIDAERQHLEEVAGLVGLVLDWSAGEVARGCWSPEGPGRNEQIERLRGGPRLCTAAPGPEPWA